MANLSKFTPKFLELPPMKTPLNASAEQTRVQLKKNLFRLRIHYLVADVVDSVIMYFSALLMALFHLLSLVLLVVCWVLHSAFQLSTAGELGARMSAYYDRSLEQINKACSEISDEASRLTDKLNEIDRVFRSIMHPVIGTVFTVSDHMIIIDEIKLTREDRRELSGDIASFCLFVIRVLTFTA